MSNLLKPIHFKQNLIFCNLLNSVLIVLLVLFLEIAFKNNNYFFQLFSKKIIKIDI